MINGKTSITGTHLQYNLRMDHSTELRPEVDRSKGSVYEYVDAHMPSYAS